MTPGQHFVLGDGPAVVVAEDPDGDPLGNWQITGGSGARKLAIDRDTGEITGVDLDPGSYTLTVIVSDGRLAAREEVVTIDVPERLTRTNIRH